MSEYEKLIQKPPIPSTDMEKVTPVVQAFCKERGPDPPDFEQLRRGIRKKYHTDPSKIDMRTCYNALVSEGSLEPHDHFEAYCKVKKSREGQGVLVVTVVLSDRPNGQLFTCEYDCKYCVNIEGHARSYCPGEPAVDRGRENDWDPVRQVHSRVRQYIRTGIMKYEVSSDTGYKLDIVIEGGTYTSYPRDYRERFIHQLFYACNTFYENRSRPMGTLAEEQHENQTSSLRVIGISIETRPDTVSVPLMRELRYLGVTRVQIGIQHLDDAILRKVNRRCYLRHTKRSIRILREHAFKVAVHYMPDLPGATMEQDLAMWDTLFSDPDLEFDFCKLYPCMTLPGSEIYDWYQQGDYVPYAHEWMTCEKTGMTIPKIIYVCAEFMHRCKKHHRVERVLRDLPVSVQVAGCSITNLRQLTEQYLEKRGQSVVEIRHREVRDRVVQVDQAKMMVEMYPASQGQEYFISMESPDETYLYGFLRLRIPSHETKCIAELKGRGLIREIHVYGVATPVGNPRGQSAQHQGFGTKMLLEAEKRTVEHGLRGLAVISGEGVKGFYKKRGFYDGTYYMLKDLES